MPVARDCDALQSVHFDDIVLILVVTEQSMKHRSIRPNSAAFAKQLLLRYIHDSRETICVVWAMYNQTTGNWRAWAYSQYSLH